MEITKDMCKNEGDQLTGGLRIRSVKIKESKFKRITTLIEVKLTIKNKPEHSISSISSIYELVWLISRCHCWTVATFLLVNSFGFFEDP